MEIYRFIPLIFANYRSNNMNTQKQHLASVAVATPTCVISQEQAAEFVEKHYDGKLKRSSLSIARKVFCHPSIKQRSFAFNSPSVLLDESPDSRVERFTEYAVKLSAQAANKALKEAGLDPGNVTALVVNTCTGYICPGISTYLIETMGLRPDIRAYDLVGSGCGGAIPNLQLCGSILKEENDGVVLSVSVEICSSTFQMDNDLSLIVSNALFGDGAAAAVYWNKPQGMSIIGSASFFEPKYREDIRFIHKDGQLHNQLSKNLPALVAPAVKAAVDKLLGSLGMTRADISRWALHPGGENVINAVKEEMELTEEQLEPTRRVLSEYGNMSSPTVWFVMKQIMDQGISPGGLCLAVAFGAGFSVHTCLFRAN